MKNEVVKEVRTQIIFLICFFAVWQLCNKTGLVADNALPSLEEILRSLKKAFVEDDLAMSTLYSLGLLGRGLGLGVILAFVFSSLAMVSVVFKRIYNLIVSIFDLIPGVALMPLAITWFGIGEGVIIFIVFHGVIWPMSRSVLDGFKGVPRLYLEEGTNFGLGGFRLVTGIYLPAASAAIISGLRVGWARAWRGLIAIEMIFGTTGSGSGIGWYIFERRTFVDTPGIYAALIVIMAIGIVVEYAIFRNIENRTVRKWGMTA
ncbi:MAG: ABC transporter permease [Anaerovoracaceae bacterium]|jgi:NitT/TauT family transport system permease protein